ncbi:MAG: hypothetical protein GTO03_08310, partial [Planctomycetales bacterium]|nr:hypothetical protein [Planctomycetales bacterium]
MTHDTAFEMITIDLDDAPVEDPEQVSEAHPVGEATGPVRAEAGRPEDPQAGEERADRPEAAGPSWNRGPTGAEAVAAEEAAWQAGSVAAERPPLVGGVAPQPVDRDVVDACDRIHQAVFSDQETPLLVFLAAERGPGLAEAARRVAAALVGNFGPPVLLLDFSSEKELTRTFPHHTADQPVSESIHPAGGIGPIAATASTGLYLGTADARAKTADCGQAAAIEGL